MNSNPLAIALVLLAVVFLVVAGLYYEGVLQILVTDPHATHHTSHAILFGGLAVVSLIAANFVRDRRV